MARRQDDTRALSQSVRRSPSSTPRRLLTKDALCQLWPDVTVKENHLTHAMAKLRKDRGDTVHERRFIVTVPGQGYRLVASVRREADQEQASLPATPQPLHITRLMILPLKLLRAADEYDFLAFSIPDAITSSLSGLEAITVRSSATAARAILPQAPGARRRL